MSNILSNNSDELTHASNKPNIFDYLERIKYSGTLALTLQTLASLQEAHVLAVPYENLDILAGKYLSLEIPDIYEKIVIRKRGGYCFELNGLFAWLLRELGFNTTEFYGRFLFGEPLEIPMRRHRISRVIIDDKSYICDVGVGIPAPRRPLEFVKDKIQRQADEHYRIVSHAQLGWIVETYHKDVWKRLYSFTEDEQFPIDFEMPHHWCTTHPDSIFLQFTMAYIRTPEGRKTIADVEDENGNKVKEFRIFSRDKVETYIPLTEKDYREALVEYFGITLD